MHEPSVMQRLLREKALGRYLAALERGDIDGIIEGLERAKNDPVLERMILEVHETYQTEEEFLALVQEENEMEFKEGIHKSNLRGQSNLPEAAPAPEPVPPRKRGKYARPLQVIAAVLLICLVVSGVLVVRNLHTAQTGAQVLPPKWCTEMGAPIKSNTSGPELDDIVTISTNDVWALGSLVQYKPTVYSDTPLLEHWDGVRWSVVPTAARGSALNYQHFSAISAVSADDIWIVGSAFHYTDSAHSESVQPLIERWDGSHWNAVKLPADFPSSFLTTVAALSANNVWVAGQNGNVSQLEHWDGSRWSQIHPPASFNSGVFNSFTVLAPDNIWAAGGFVDSNGMPTAPLLAHWDGRQWTLVPSNITGSAFFTKIAARTANDIWAVGIIYQNNRTSVRALIAHWDGTRWSAAGVF